MNRLLVLSYWGSGLEKKKNHSVKQDNNYDMSITDVINFTVEDYISTDVTIFLKSHSRDRK